jgi:hypothetical protein
MRRPAGVTNNQRPLLRRGGLALLVALIGAAVGPAVSTAAPVVGSDQVQSFVDSTAAGSAKAFRYTAPAAGSMDELNVYVDGSSVPSSLSVGLYANSNSRPKGRMTACTVTAPKAGWNACKAPAAAVTSGTQYWLAVLAPTGSGTLNFRDRPRDGSVSYSSSSSSLASLPASFPVGSKRNGYSPASIFGATAVVADSTPPSTPAGLAKTAAT